MSTPANDGASQTLDSPFGPLSLQRRPLPAPKAPLQAWDAADRALLGIADTQRAQLPGADVLLVNDAFGALAVALARAAARPRVWSDSRVSHLAILENAARNACAAPVIVPGHASPCALGDALVLWRLPRNRAWLLAQLAVLRHIARHGSPVYAAAMSKHASPDTLALLQQYWGAEVSRLRGPNHTLLFSLGAPAPEAPAVPEQSRRVAVEGDAHAQTLLNLPNAFSRGRLDEGAALLLEQLPTLPAVRDAADLGCGDGVLGLALRRLQPLARIWLIDESCQALCSAAFNADVNVNVNANADADAETETVPQDGPSPRCVLADAFDDEDGVPAQQRFDLILCNPPFHQQHVVGDQIAWGMLQGSRRHLRSGGRLWLVGNRHLDYHLKLKRLFGNCRILASNPRFVVLEARRGG